MRNRRAGSLPPRGTFPLRWFFQAAAGEEIDAARTSVRDEVADVVRGEDPAEPLSDEAIQAELCRRGHRVARRTVAKYREELGIPSSYRRRRHG